jgi:hypothetical protein
VDRGGGPAPRPHRWHRLCLDGSNTVVSDDIVNGEVKGLDLAADSVGSGKVADGSVKNADLSTGASSSNTIADGGIHRIDVKNNTLSGAQVDESTLFNDNSLDGADIDESSLGLIRGSGSVRGRTIHHGTGIFSQVLGPRFWDPDLPYSLFYCCPGLDTPGPGATDGLWRLQNQTGQSINLIVDNGAPDPSFAGALADGATHDDERGDAYAELRKSRRKGVRTGPHCQTMERTKPRVRRSAKPSARRPGARL